MSIENAIHLNRFKPRPYQIPPMDAILNKGYKRALIILPRRAGKDVMAFNLLIRAALKKVGVYYYVFPTYSQAKKVIWTSITNQGVRFLDYIPSELIISTNSQEMIIRFTNGSIIQLVGSDNVDGLVGTNPQGIIFSEYALQDPRAYTFLRPILMANDGFAMFISCVVPNTLIIGSGGLQRIKNVSPSRDTYSDLNQPVFGLGGFNNAEQFYYGGKQPTIKIVLSTGHFLQCTPIHQIWTGSEWKQAQHLQIGDLIPVQYGQDIWGPGLKYKDFTLNTHGASKELPELNNDLLYLLGLIHADGNYDSNKICVTKKKDQQIIDFLHKYGFKTRPDGMHHEYSNKNLCALLEHLGFKHGARNKTFPESLFSCTKDQMRAFIQGIFDGDGSSNSLPSKNGRLKLTSTCLEFLQDLSVILLNFGVVGTIRCEDKKPTEIVKVWSRIYNLEISSHFAHIFYRDIGFRLDRKQNNRKHIPDKLRIDSGNIYPVDQRQLVGYPMPMSRFKNKSRIMRRTLHAMNQELPHPYLEKILSEKFYYTPIKEIIQCEDEEVFDFVIPNTHSFFNNGLIGHNTPRGRGNHLYEMYQIAKESSDWFCMKKDITETKHISLAEIEKDRAEGLMSDDLIEQEYFVSFERGVEGSYYGKYIDRMRRDNRIGDVPFEPGFKVHTAWDIGQRDSTVIIFFQVVGQTIRLIDCYDNSKQGLEHYAKIINQKEYNYGKHFGPHDIAVKEWGSGLTRIEKAKSLGINFTIAPNISIEDGIECVRSIFSKMWIDQTNCKKLIHALENYRQEYDTKRKVYRDTPLHDWSSDFSDSLRYLCLSLPKTRDGLSAEELDRRYKESLYGDQSSLPAVFRDDLPGY